jgi:hypothetical protein
MSSDIPARPAAGARTLPDDLRSDVLDILSDAVQWRLPEVRWAGVEKLVQALHEALRAGDVAAVEAKLGDLELAAPLRITPIGGEPAGPATRRLRNLAEQVVRDLGEGLGPDDDGPANDQGDRDGSGAGAGR